MARAMLLSRDRRRYFDPAERIDMTPHRPLFHAACGIASALVLTGLVSCSNGSNQDVRDARAAELEAVREQRQQEAEQRREQMVESADAREDAVEELAEGLPPETEERLDAEADFMEDREVFRADARERLEKIDARITELQALVDQAGYRATLEAKRSLDEAKTQRDLVQQQIDRLPTVTSDQWMSATTMVEERLDELAALVEEASDEVETAL
jgi:hypothetical protein